MHDRPAAGLIGASRAPFVVAPDKFKGTLSAAEVAAALARGLRSGGREAIELPIADGGEGTAEALLRAHGGEWLEASVSDALGRPVEARLALLAGGAVAVAEAAQATGLWRLERAERDAWSATSRGVGELIAAAADAGAGEVIVAPGGSASTDGGAGALEALDRAGVAPRIVVASDTRVAYEDSARVFAPQKGADPGTVRRLDRRLRRIASAWPRDPAGVEWGGGGGGLAGGLWAARGAALVSGAALVLDALGFDAAMRGAAAVVTGEGRLDEQTPTGKAVGEVATRCRQSGVVCHAVVGRNALDPFLTRVLDLASVTEARSPAALEAAGLALAN